MSMNTVKADPDTKTLAGWCLDMFEDQDVTKIAGVSDVNDVKRWWIGYACSKEQHDRLDVAFTVYDLLARTPDVDPIDWMTTKRLHLENQSYCTLIGNDESEAVLIAAQAEFDAICWH